MVSQKSCFDTVTMSKCFLTPNLVEPKFEAKGNILFLIMKLVDIEGFDRAREIAGFLSSQKIAITDANKTSISCKDCRKCGPA